MISDEQLEYLAAHPDGVGPTTVQELARELLALRWRPITPECLPKVGDELYSGRGREKVMILPEEYAPMVPMVEDFTYAGWTHFRPIAPPSRKEETNGKV